MSITPRFEIGQKVWSSSPERSVQRHDCPDCLGTKKWRAVSPAGQEYSFDCPRCQVRYISNDNLSLEYALWVPACRELTIGSVRFDSAGDEPYTYMCKETGVGSGSVYGESQFGETKEEAMRISALRAEKLNRETPAMVERFNKTLTLSDYQLHEARAKEIA